MDTFETTMEAVLKKASISRTYRVAVAAAADPVVLTAVCAAHGRGLIEPILFGDPDAIARAAEAAGLDLSPFAVAKAVTDEIAARDAVSLVRTGGADMLMKGLLQTPTFLRAVLNKENGLRGSGILSHVSILHSPVLGRMLLLTDAAMVPYPDLKMKVKLVQNAVRAANGLGVERPRVAALAAVELVNPDMPASIDAALLAMMNRRGQLNGCVVDGPLAMDLALSEEAARHKGIASEVAGRADILLFHNIEAANGALKAFTIAGGCLFGGVLMGATAPVVLSSRSDSAQSKLYAIACAAAICGRSA